MNQFKPVQQSQQQPKKRKKRAGVLSRNVFCSALENAGFYLMIILSLNFLNNS